MVKQKSKKSIISSAEFESIISAHPIVMLIIGRRRFGKSALGFHMIEKFHKKHPELKIFVVSLPKEKQRLLPDWIHPVDNIEELPDNCVALIDEAALKYHAHRWQKKETEVMDQMISFSGQRKQTFIFITHTMRKFAVTLLMDINVILCKKPSLLHSKLERSEFRKLIEVVEREFNKLPEDKVKKATYVISDDYQGFIYNPLPSFWSEQLSETYATNRNNQEEEGVIMSKEHVLTKEDLDMQIQETERKISEIKEKDTRVKRASVILSPDGTQIGSISFFDNLKTIFILGTKRYTGEGEKAFWVAAAYAASLGHKIKPLQVG